MVAADIAEALLTALEQKRQFAVVQPKQLQKGGVQFDRGVRYPALSRATEPSTSACAKHSTARR